MFGKDREQEQISKDITGLHLDYFKLLILMYADDIVLFLETNEGLQNGLNYMYLYDSDCQKMETTC